jgi:hypothetical protein
MVDMDLVTLVAQGVPGTPALPLLLRPTATLRSSYSPRYRHMLSNLLLDMVGCVVGPAPLHAPFLLRGCASGWEGV